eukprot:TRINITY_DN387_c0_g1_i2.p1 TRINITY_DN387_c0_g1~~TRINITY_DN387_c0_g1_i2.p1  ORF type:complete len:507 (-),score=73.30 TRINITY_DN387_c0_g1_i2:974-2458(-)
MNIDEVARHRSADDCYIAVNGKVYDVTKWLPKHPGGMDMILVSSGRDATQIMASYHPFSHAKALKVLDQYYVCDLIRQPTDLPEYVSPPNHAKFYPTLCARVGEYFRSRNLDTKWHPWLIWRAFLIYGGIALAYYHTLWGFGTSGLVAAMLCAAAWGFMQAIFSLQFMHDASHAALTRNPKVWRYVGHSWDVVTGASFYCWLHQHTVGHHLYTNVRGADPDIGAQSPEAPELRRVVPSQRWFPWYALQKFYVFAMYPLLTFKFRYSDFQVLLSHMNGPISVTPPDGGHTFWFVAGKALFPFFRFIAPLAFGSPHSIWALLGLHIITETVTGGWLAFNFQVSHVAPSCDFYERPCAAEAKRDDAPDTKSWNVVRQDWAVSQVVTAQNYSVTSRSMSTLSRLWCDLTAWQSGHLNYQIEHHLFPSIQQLHYPDIAPIVKGVCDEFRVPYNSLPSFVAAVGSHLDHLQNHAADPAAGVSRAPQDSTATPAVRGAHSA